MVTYVTYFTHNKEERDKEKSLHLILLALHLQLAQMTGRGKGAGGMLIPHPPFAIISIVYPMLLFSVLTTVVMLAFAPDYCPLDLAM